jgi:hypothetical protein
MESEGLQFEPINNFTKDSIQVRQDLYKAICKKLWDVSLIAK